MCIYHTIYLVYEIYEIASIHLLLINVRWGTLNCHDMSNGSAMMRWRVDRG